MKDPATNRAGPKALPDAVTIIDPKEEDNDITPIVKDYRPQEPVAAAPQAAPEAQEAAPAEVEA